MRPDDHSITKTHGRDPRRLVPWILFAILALATVFVWWLEVNHDRARLVSHTDDVAVQASRRLEVFVESRLVVAEIFSERWSTHERRDFSEQRFEKFASVLLSKIPGFHTVWLVRPDRSSGWVAPAGSRSVLNPSNLGQWPVFAEARQRGKTVLSPPIDAGQSAVSFIAVLPLNRQLEFLGYLVVEFDADALFKFCFHQRIRSEFRFKIDDGGRLLHRHSPDRVAGRFGDAPIQTHRRFSVRNRIWRMVVAPREHDTASYLSYRNLPILLFGLLLSGLVTGLFALFDRQAREKRLARAEAEDAHRDREDATSALLESEARYRSVFDSASDGLLLIDDAGVIVDANHEACRMHGYEAEALIRQPVEVLFVPEQRKRLRAFATRSHLATAARVELTGLALDGSQLDVDVKGSVFEYRNTTRVLLVTADVTEQKNAERRLALLSRKVLMAQEDERARVARDLHDELGQIITALRLELDLSESRLSLPVEESESAFAGPIDLLEQATAELRRICRGLRPPLLDDLGLGPAVERLLQTFGDRTDVEVRTKLQFDDDARLSNEVALSVYRIIQEATTNVTRHSEATAITVDLAVSSDLLHLSLYDNGVGFDKSARWASRGSGITGMEERGHLVGGELRVDTVQGEGTRVVLTVPLATPASGGER